jgi:hypothetical protein
MTVEMLCRAQVEVSVTTYASCNESVGSFPLKCL